MFYDIGLVLISDCSGMVFVVVFIVDNVRFGKYLFFDVLFRFRKLKRIIYFFLVK